MLKFIKVPKKRLARLFGGLFLLALMLRRIGWGETGEAFSMIAPVLLWVFLLELLSLLLGVIKGKVLLRRAAFPALFCRLIGRSALNRISVLLPLRGDTFLMKKWGAEFLIAYRGIGWLVLLLATSIALVIALYPISKTLSLILLLIGFFSGIRIKGDRPFTELLKLVRRIKIPFSPAVTGQMDETDRGLARAWETGKGRFSFGLVVDLVIEGTGVFAIFLLGNALAPGFSWQTALLLYGVTAPTRLLFKAVPWGVGFLEVVFGLVTALTGEGLLAGIVILLALRLVAVVFTLIGFAFVGNPMK